MSNKKMLDAMNNNQTDNIKIERGVPVPEARGFLWPFKEMAIGDSFLIKSESHKTNAVRMAAHYFSSKNPTYRFTIRKAEGGLRVWRITPLRKPRQI